MWAPPANCVTSHVHFFLGRRSWPLTDQAPLGITLNPLTHLSGWVFWFLVFFVKTKL